MFVTFGTLRVKAVFTQHWCEFCTDVAENLKTLYEESVRGLV